jgi:hypothetical protein
LNAHDLAIEKNIFEFITADFKLLEFKEKILNITKIHNMVPLTNFAF